MRRDPSAERRKGFRKPLDFGTDIVRVNQVAFKRKWDDECGVNIGQQGFCCCSSKKLPEASQVSCLILFPPPNDLKVIEAEAKLIWQKARGAGRRQLWYHGFEFTKLEAPQRKLIDQALKPPEPAEEATAAR